MIKCAVFDLDGTLLNTLDTICHYCNRVLEKEGYEPIETEKYKIFVGDGAKALIKRAFKYSGEEIAGERLESILSDYVEGYNKNPEYLTEAYEGIKELLESLSKKGIALSVFSNKPESSVKPLAEKYFGKGLFQIILGQKGGLPKKPNPQGLLNILKELSVKPQECIYIGDTDTDMKTGKSAGAYTVGCSWGFRDRKELKESGADFIAERPSDILKLI